jgi:3-isopropylmalate dehydrogenase
MRSAMNGCNFIRRSGKLMEFPFLKMGLHSSYRPRSKRQNAADAVEKAVMFVTANKLKSLAAGRMGYSTSQVGDLVAKQLA